VGAPPAREAPPASGSATGPGGTAGPGTTACPTPVAGPGSIAAPRVVAFTRGRVRDGPRSKRRRLPNAQHDVVGRHRNNGLLPPVWTITGFAVRGASFGKQVEGRNWARTLFQSRANNHPPGQSATLGPGGLGFRASHLRRFRGRCARRPADRSARSPASPKVDHRHALTAVLPENGRPIIADNGYIPAEPILNKESAPNAGPR
jgi:hypothetical protein